MCIITILVIIMLYIIYNVKNTVFVKGLWMDILCVYVCMIEFIVQDMLIF